MNCEFKGLYTNCGIHVCSNTDDTPCSLSKRDIIINHNIYRASSTRLHLSLLRRSCAVDYCVESWTASGGDQEVDEERSSAGSSARYSLSTEHRRPRTSGQAVQLLRLTTARIQYSIQSIIAVVAGCCAYSHQQWCAVRFSTFQHLIRPNFKPSTWGWRRCRFPKFDRDPLGVAGGVAKIKVAYNLVLLTGFQWYAWLAPATPPLEVIPEQKKSDLFYV